MSAGDLTAKHLPLGLSQPDGADELEAERMAARVLATSPSRAPERPMIEQSTQMGFALQRAVGIRAVTQLLAAPSTHTVVAQSGEELDPEFRRSMEHKYRADFSDVRIHCDSEAAASAHGLNAQAYTIGNHIVFSAGKYDPTSTNGQHILAHELAHVVQQRSGPVSGVPIGTDVAVSQPGDPFEQVAEASAREVMARLPSGRRPASDAVRNRRPAANQLAVQRDDYKVDSSSVSVDLTDAGLQVQRDASEPDKLEEVHYAGCAKNPGCPEDFCRPFASQADARADRVKNLESVIASVPNAKAAEYYRRYAEKPGPAGDISGEVGADFQKAEETRRVTQQLVDAAQQALKDSPPSFPDGKTVINPNIRDVLADDIIGPIINKLRFTDYLEVPGLLAGGIDTAQGTCSVGAVPSTQPDERLIEGSFTVSKNDDGSIFVSFVSPVGLKFTVRDTLDFCPGNCGGSFAQAITVKMSRWEASNISGDVSFTVIFDAPGLVGSPV